MLCCRRSVTTHSNLPRSTFTPTKFHALPITIRFSIHQRRFTATSSPAKPPLSARIVSSLPPSAKPFAYLARLDKPVGSWLLYWPCGSFHMKLDWLVAWSITLAAAHGHVPPTQLFSMLGLFGVGAVVMRGAGCTINDLWDRNLDKRVNRKMYVVVDVGWTNSE